MNKLTISMMIALTLAFSAALANADENAPAATTFGAVHFGFNSAELTGSSKAQLDTIAAHLIAHPELDITIPGYTDKVGGEEDNLELGSTRASAARDYLIGKGVPADHIFISTKGESEPVAGGDAANRRARFALEFAYDEQGDMPVDPSRLPIPVSDHDDAPATAAVGLPAGGIVSQAGIGGPVAYGRRGVLELGGNASVAIATDFTEMSVGPSIGFFLSDNLEFSLITRLQYAKAGDSSRTSFSGLIEPSYHVPLSRSLFVFGGVGFGLGYAEGPGAGFAMAPRLGLNMMIGRSGVLSPAAFFEYTTHSAVETPTGTALAVSSAYGTQVAYTVMW